MSDLDFKFKIENCGIETNKIKNVNGNINFNCNGITKNCYIKSKENLELQNSKIINKDNNLITRPQIIIV